MGQFDLQAAFRRCRAFAKNLQDQPCAVDNFALELLFQITLLDRRQRTVDDHQFGLFKIAGRSDVFDLAGTEQRVGFHRADGNDHPLCYDNTNGQSEATGFFRPGLGVNVIRLSRDIRAHDNSPRSARDLAHQIVIETQPSSLSQSLDRSTWLSG